MASPETGGGDDEEVGAGTFPLFVVWLIFLLALIVLYVAVGAVNG
jgi:hypothetical protein